MSTELAGRWVEQQYRIAAWSRVACAVRPGESGTIDAIDTYLNEVIEFDERLAVLSGLIGSVTRPGDYCVHGRLFAPMPRIEAGTAGVLSFPIPQTQAQALVADADRAPYGRGQETIVDPSVRDCWQLAPDRVRIAGRTWADTFADILDRDDRRPRLPGGRRHGRTLQAPDL